MSAMASQINGITIVCSTIYSGAYQRKQQSPASLDFVRGIHRWSVDYLHKGPVTWKMFPFDDVIIHQEPLILTWINFIVAWVNKTSIKNVVLIYLPIPKLQPATVQPLKFGNE